jgi:F-type H+-transporting ATPase subunit alpha
MAVEKQIVIIYAATKKHLLDVAVSDIAEYEKILFELIENQYPEIFRTIREQKVLTEEIEPKLVLAIEQAKESLDGSSKK